MPKTTQIIHWRARRARRRQRSGQAVLKIASLLLLIALLAALFGLVGTVAAGTAVYAYFTQDLPDYTSLEGLDQAESDTFETSKIYAWGDAKADGSRDLILIYEIIDPLGGDRQWLKLDQIAPALLDATIAIEDKSFWANPGFDLQGIGRAFYEYVLEGGQVQGGSSITQQVIKNNLIEPERRAVGDEVSLDDYRRKLEELLLAHRATNSYSKEQILEWYLNTNFYGNLAYGVEAAARV
jgi:membrane peptidoglycan carboxypeptidase